MPTDQEPHVRMMEWAQRTGLLRELLTARRESAIDDLVVLIATPDTPEGEYLHEVARLGKRAAEVSRRFAAQRRAGVPRFLVGLTTASSLRASEIAAEALDALDTAATAGGVPVFVIDAEGFVCGTMALRLPSVPC